MVNLLMSQSHKNHNIVLKKKMKNSKKLNIEKKIKELSWSRCRSVALHWKYFDELNCLIKKLNRLATIMDIIFGTKGEFPTKF